jgi:cytoskeletal protein CcmA (bactofilin family)
MAKQTRTTLKGYFETGDIPNQNQYGHLIDSQLNLQDGNMQLVSGSISASSYTSATNIIVGTDITASGNISASGTLDITGNVNFDSDLDVDGTTNLDNTDIDGTLVVDGTNISLDATTTFNIDNSNTSNGITIGTATSGVPISIGHTTSNTTVNDNLIVTGNITSSGDVSSSLASTASFGSAIFANLPTTKPSITGSLWLSGSAGSNSKYLVVFTG